jgi:hypothetical protein
VKAEGPEGKTLADGTSESLLDRAKFFREHVQTILSLATGSFVLSVTFLHDIAPKTQHVEYLRKSWGVFVLTIVLGLIYNYVLSIYVSISGRRYGTLLSVISFFFHVSFVLAVCYLLRFGTANL